MAIRFVVLLALFCYANGSIIGPNAEVTLRHGGKVRGSYKKSTDGKGAIEFLGIPFAQPPVGRLRFGRPKPAASFRGVMNATRPPRDCVQTVDTFFGQNYEGSKMWNPNTKISEDCLYLNIWAPAKIEKPLAVMVWIYGGGFYSGSSTLSLYDGKVLATNQNVIVVSMNYRLNLYGFLYFGTPEAPGNVGLLDQTLALKWVQDNIRGFGGNPKQVTIFGESAGAASVDLQILSPLSKGLFTNAIMQSGSATATWVIVDHNEAIERSLKLAKSVSCWDGKGKPDKQKIIECLQEKPYYELTKNEYIATEFIPMSFVPVVDGYFLPEDPNEMLAAGKGNVVNTIYGTNHDEGNYFIVYFLTKLYEKHKIFTTTSFLNTKADFETAAKKLLPAKFRNSKVGVKAVLHEYGSFHPVVTAEERQDNLDKMAGDYQFSCPVLKSARLKAMAGQNVYVYYMTHRSTTMPWPKWMGVLHGYEIQYVFGEPLNPTKGYSKKEKQLSYAVMDYYGNFAKTGNPNGPRLDTWPKYTPESQDYLVWAAGDLRRDKGLRTRQCQFWDKALPEMIKASENPTCKI